MGTLNTGLWRLSMRPQGLTTHMWLLSHEGDLKGLLQGTPANLVDQNAYLAVLKKRSISFYDTTKKREAHKERDAT